MRAPRPDQSLRAATIPDTSWIAPAPDRPFLGTTRFRPVALLGRGGMGSVYRVHDAETGREVALKTIPAVDSDRLYYLKSEFRALAGISHPNLAELYELVAQGGECFFTMELVDGVGFLDHIRGKGAEPPGPGAGDEAPDSGARPRTRGEDGGAGADAARLARLESALPQLVLGLTALHAAGKVHRDVKPSNIMVTRRGRVVILDFGLVIHYRQRGRPELQLAGTLPYMAPEQMRGAPLSPATDWYAVGVLLYEAIAGRLPFGGAPFQMVQDKEHLRARRPRELAPEAPPALDALVMRLLDPDPARRPGGEAILEALRESGGLAGDDEEAQLRALSASEAALGAIAAAEAPFVGRAGELAALRSAFRDLEQGKPAMVLVEGPSGMGKTELLARFVASIEADRDVVVLRGRCHPQESVPYKAFDPIVDALSHYLRDLHPIHAEGLLPERRAALVRLFPVLGRVPSLGVDAGMDDGAAGVEHAQDAQELRQQGFEALRELLGNLGQLRLLVVWIDDLQWGDADSGRLLRELLRPEAAPPLLLLLSYRSEDVGRSPVLDDARAAAGALPPGAARTLTLGPLGEAHARALLAALLAARWSTFAPLAARLTAESAGSPFFLGEIARHLRHAPPRAAADLRLSRVLLDRIDRLSPAERRLLAITSVAGGPLDRTFALRVAGLGERGRPDAARLAQLSLLRTTQIDGRPAVEAYHDRIREALVAQLSPDERRWCHQRLAEALRATPSPDPEALLTHYLGAGDARRAAHFAVLAADRAAATLAFDRAAELYRAALGLAGAPRWELHRKLGQVLAAAGRGGEAAESFMAAAAALGAQSPDHAELLTLERCAAEQYLHSGRIGEGMRVMGAVLARVGVALPDTPRRALWRSLLERLRILTWGIELSRRSPDQVAPAALARLDALWGASTSLAMINYAVADALGVQQLDAALALGERSRACRALALEAAAEACLGISLLRRRSARLLRVAEDLARETGDPYDRAWTLASRGACAWFAASWSASVRHGDAAAALFRERCRGVAWELAIVDAFVLPALAQLGQLRELSARLARSLRDAERRGDLFAMDNCRLGQPGIAWLAADRAAEYEAWLSPGEPDPGWQINPTQRYHQLVSAVQTALYLGDPLRALARVEAAWPCVVRARLLWIAYVRVELRHLRARAALAAAAAARRGASVVDAGRDGRDDARLTRRALGEASRLDRERLPVAAPFAALIRAGAARLAGDDEHAARALAFAVAAFDGAEMALYREAARACLGAIRGGDEGGALVAESRRWMDQQGVRDPEALIAVLAPACGAR